MTTNCIKFTSADIETAKGVGSISTLTFDLDITVEPVVSANPMGKAKISKYQRTYHRSQTEVRRPSPEVYTSEAKRVIAKPAKSPA